MYEDTKYKTKTNWKSLFIKLMILLVVVFLICFIIFRPRTNKTKVSLTDNIMSVKEGAINYFKNSNLSNIGDHDKVSLNTLIDSGYTESQKNGKNTCDRDESFAYITKTRDDEYVLKISLTCGKTTKSEVFDLNNDDLAIIAVEEEIVEDTQVEEVIAEEPIITEDPIIETPITRDEPKKSSSTKKNNSTVIASNSTNNNIINSSNGKTLRYKHIAYGDWIIGNKTGNAIENSTKTVTLYCYCLNGNCVEDLIDNIASYVGYTASYSRTVNVPVYRYIYTVWSDSTHINGFINTGITEYR